MNFDLKYVPLEDRLVLSLRGHAAWLVTRNLLLKLIGVWLDALEKVELPSVPVPMGKRSLVGEHELSMELDRPVQNNVSIPEVDVVLLEKVDIRVSAVTVTLVLYGGERGVTVNLTRRDAHLVLELLAGRARAAKWLDPVKWPDWLGGQTPKGE